MVWPKEALQRQRCCVGQGGRGAVSLIEAPARSLARPTLRPPQDLHKSSRALGRVSELGPPPLAPPPLQRLDLMLNSTAKAGGVYLYANQQASRGGK